MQSYFADFHVHIGLSESGRWIKIPTSNRLTLRNILHEAAERKGMNIIGVVDALSPVVRQDLSRLVAEGLLELDSQGGYRYKNKLTLLLGAEIETSEPDGGLAHTLVFLPDMELMSRFAALMSKHIKNIDLSSQNAHMSLSELLVIARSFEAMIIPAHVFTPHKSLYGSCTNRMDRILRDREIASVSAVELGLSSDTALADRIGELGNFTYISNSDAHSLDKIAREYNILNLAAPTFHECLQAFFRQAGRAVVANFGLDPRLGKYHRTFCSGCNSVLEEQPGCSGFDLCPFCGSKKIIRGVLDRINEIADYTAPRYPEHRPPYRHQVPLSFVPGIGKKALEKLIGVFGNEMAILHQAGEKELSAVVGAKSADIIVKARGGQVGILAGGGGIYGKLTKN